MKMKMTAKQVIKKRSYIFFRGLYCIFENIPSSWVGGISADVTWGGIWKKEDNMGENVKKRKKVERKRENGSKG
jgi:hypothetical protein